MFSACKKDTYVPIASVCPVVESTNPENGTVNVPLGQEVTVTFNEKMNATTITQASFSIAGVTKVEGTISYNATTFTASFSPLNPLSANTTYTGKITSAIKDWMGNSVQNDYIWSFSTGATIVPIVVSTDPANNTSGVFINKTIMTTFNTSMDPATFTASSFMIKEGANTLSGAMTFINNTVNFSPSANLKPNTTYTGTVTTATKSYSGVSLTNDYIWHFTTGSTIAPVVVSTDPQNNAINVVANKVISATFSTAMNPSTFNTNTFIVRQGSTIVTGVVSYNGLTASFVPTGGLVAGNTYTATITNGVKSTGGTPLANNYTWIFTTVSPIPQVLSTDPTGNATGVVVDKLITATFNVSMDPATINTTSFIIKQGTVAISGVVNYSGKTASFKPIANLLPGTVYYGTITTGAKNMAGVSITSSYTWNFTTSTGPIVVSTDPTGNATGVLLDKIITATFNVPMDPLTINSGSFLIKQGTLTVPGTITYTGTTASFKPLATLLPGTTYYGTITTGAKNGAGMSIASSYTWNFTTLLGTGPQVTSTDPANNDVGIALNKIVTASFNMAMDPLTINAATFTLKLGTASVPGAVSYAGTKASFTPISNLLSDNTYTATITTGAKNLAGAPIANNYVWKFSTKAHTGPQAPDLKSVMQFGIISGVGVSNNAGFSVINDMNVGIYPGFRSAITGFPPAMVVNGNIYAADDLLPVGVTAMLRQAKTDLTDAYNYAKGASSPAPVTVSGDQGGKTLAPGIYTSTSTLGISSGDLTLDAKGDANAIWIFQVASSFTTTGGSGGNVILTGGAQANNVYWQVSSSATIGDNTSFKGNILAYTSITMNSKAVAAGRMLAINAAVVMTSTNIINKP